MNYISATREKKEWKLRILIRESKKDEFDCVECIL